MIKQCGVCKKSFDAKGSAKYCSKICSKKVFYRPKPKYHAKKETLCWGCKNACGKCSWSAAFVPVNGWNAEKTIIKGNLETDELIESFRVIDCPEFMRG